MHSTRTSTALFVQPYGVEVYMSFQPNFGGYSTVNISGPPDVTCTVCSN